MTTLLPGALIVKEGRALAPIWLSTAVAIVAGTQAGMLMGALLAFILGAAALGVFSIGHEYANRTLTSLLAQPLTRSRLLLSKVAVLIPLLLLLSATAAMVLLRADGADRMLGGGTVAAEWRLVILVLTPLLGLCVAPWVTMLFRSGTAGLVFTLAVPASLWIAGQVARAASVDFDFVQIEANSPFAYRPALTLMTIGMLVVSFVAAVHGWTLFRDLEALDTPREFLPSSFKRSLRAGPAAATTPSEALRRRRPLLLFLQKELRLYGMAFAVAGLYTIGWTALWLARADTYLADDAFQLFAAMYGLFIAVLVGAMSIAEERALGTADTQNLQPWPFWKQWVSKLTTVGLLSLLVGLALPRGLQTALPLIQSSTPVGPDFGVFRFVLPNALNGPVATLLLTLLFSCYVSSLCVGGLRALLTGLPLSFSLASLYLYVFYALDRIVRIKVYGTEGQWALLESSTATRADFRISFLYSRWMAAAAFVGLVALLLILFLRNFRSAESGTDVAMRQVPRVAVYVLLAAVLLRGGGGLLDWWLFTH